MPMERYEFIRSDNLSEAKKRGRPVNHPPVLVRETGLVFPTFTEAAMSVGCTRWGVMRCCERVQKDTHGYHFNYSLDDLEE